MSVVLDGARWLRAQQIFDQVIDLASTARGAAVAAACAGDDELLRMVEGLIQADAQAAPDPQPAIATLGALSDPELRAGTRVGAFTIVRTLGVGGMGRVYLGKRADGRVEQQVAIKTLRGAFAGRDLLQRFDRERRILARLDHPNIARFIDACESAGGVPALVMEYVGGTPLLDYAQARQLDVQARLRLFAKIASAVDHAHRQLIVHRDLKPSNVLVDASGEPRLLDFGIAKSIRQDHEHSALDGHTAPESRYLSLRYAAPEQFGGAADSVAIDIYALGALLYELLAGRPPLDLQGRSLAEIQARILQEMPKPPSEVVGPQGPCPAARLRGDLDRIILHALKKEPERRYGSAAALLEDLQCVLEYRPISLRRSHRWYLLGRFLRRHALSSGLAGAAATVLLVSAVALYRQSIEVRQQRDEARAVTQFLVETFRSADPAYAGGQARVATLLGGAARKLAARTDIEAHTRRLLGLALAEAAQASGTPSSAASIDVLAIADDPALSSAERARANRIAAAVKLAADDYDEAERRASAALREETDPAAIASLYEYQAKLKQRRGDHAAAVAVLAAGEAELRQRLGEDTTALLRVRLQKAMAMAIAGDPDGALALGQSVLARMRATGQARVEIVAGLRAVFYLLSRLERSAEALPVAEELLAIVAEEYGANSMPYASALLQKAVAMANNQQWPASVDLFKAARALMVAEVGEDNLAVAKLEYSLAIGFLEAGDAASALPYIRHAVEVARRTWGESHNDTISFALTQTRALRELQRWREIVELVDPLLGPFAAGKPDSLFRLRLQLDLAEARAELDEPDEAARMLDQVEHLWTTFAVHAAPLKIRADALRAHLATVPKGKTR